MQPQLKENSPSRVEVDGGILCEQDRYDRFSRVLHWSIAALIAGMFITNWTREYVDRGPARNWWLSAHETLGLLVLALTLGRIVWWFLRTPPRPSGSPTMRRAAVAGHALLYLATLGLPFAGIGRAMAGGKDIVLLGFSIPSLTGQNDMLKTITHILHGGLVMNLLLALIAGHVAAALWHHFLVKDGTLTRMS